MASAIGRLRSWVGIEWSAVATVWSGRRTRRPRWRRPVKACGLVTSWTRWRSIAEDGRGAGLVDDDVVVPDLVDERARSRGGHARQRTRARRPGRSAAPGGVATRAVTPGRPAGSRGGPRPSVLPDGWYLGVPARRLRREDNRAVDDHHPPSDAVIGTVRSRLAAQAAVIRVSLFSLALAAAAAIVYVGYVRDLPTLAAPVSVPWPLLALAFFATEAKVIDVHFRRETPLVLAERAAVGHRLLPHATDGLPARRSSSAPAPRSSSSRASRRSSCRSTWPTSPSSPWSTLTVFRAIGTFAGPPAPIDWLAAFSATFLGAVIGAFTIATVISCRAARRSSRSCPR